MFNMRFIQIMKDAENQLLSLERVIRNIDYISDQLKNRMFNKKIWIWAIILGVGGFVIICQM